jgi:hypothetical protein
MKFCVDCAHFRTHPHSSDPSTGLCASTEPVVNLVIGEQEQTFLFCSAYRVGPCGKEAKFFIPRNDSKETT